MSVTVRVDYGNGANKSFVLGELPDQPIGDVLSLWDVLSAAGSIAPGLNYVLDDGTTATDRGGLEFNGKIVSVDGINGANWEVAINGKVQKELRRAALRMADAREKPRVQDGDEIEIRRKG